MTARSSPLFRLSLACAFMMALTAMAFAQPTVSFSPTSVNFGNQAQGSTSQPVPVTLSNTGNATLTITRIKIAGMNALDFAQTNNCGTQVLAGANCIINVTFTPTQGGTRSSSVSVTDNAGTGTQSVPLSGAGLAPAVTFAPPSLAFGTQLISTSSASQNVTLTNTGQAPLAISGIVVAGANPSEFSMTHNCGSSLAISATCTVTVTFTPSASWARTAVVWVTDNAPGSPHVIGLAGNGASGGVASFSPSSLTFATRRMGTTSAAQTVTLTNAGTAALQIGNIAAAGDYAQTNNCGSAVAAGSSCAVNVTFTPSLNGARPGWIDFCFTDPAGLQTVSLAGGGALPVPVSVKPRAASVTFSQTQQYTAYISNVQTSNVTWYVDSVAGGNSTVGTISAAGLYTPPAAAGSHIVKAVNNANTNQSASVPVVVSGFAGTFTYHNDNLRAGQNNSEAALTTGNVNKTQFGKLFTQSLDGQVYAQPLWVPSVNIAGQGAHNVVFVATQHDSVYAFDADQPGSALWHTSFIDPAVGITTIPQPDIEIGRDVSPEVGITSTPVIDAARGILFVEARTKEVSGSSVSYMHRLHALNITSGAEMPGSPIVVAASVPGTGYDNVGGVVTFNSKRQNNRSGLLLVNGIVYIAFASLEDISPYHGWVLGYNYNGSALTQVVVFNNTPNGAKAGIWHGGGGIPADAQGNLYVSTGTGTFDINKGGGITFSKLTPNGNTLTVADYFAPFNQAYLSLEKINADLSSSGPMLLPDQSGPVPHLAIFCGKTGTIYLLNRDNLGHYNATSDNVVQALYTTIGISSSPSGNWGTPAYFNSQIYIQGIKDPLKQFAVSNSLLSGGPLAVGADLIGYPGTVPVISSNGSLNGIVWVVQSDGAATSKAATLRAYDAANITHEIYNTGMAGTRDKPGPAVKFATPTVANGKVYVPTASELDVYGLLP